MPEDFINDESPIMAAIKEDAEKSKVEIPEENPDIVQDENIKTEEKDVLIDTEKEKEVINEGKVIDTESNKWDISSFNSAFEKEFESDDDIKALFNSADELKTLREGAAEKDRLLLEKEDLLNTKTDGLKLFASDKFYKVNQILINNPNLNDSAVLRLATADLDTMQDTEVLKLQKLTKLQSGDFSEADIEYAINKKYDLTADPSELEGNDLKDYNANKFLRNEDAQAARAELKELMKVEMPEKIDLLAMQNESKEKADKVLSDSLESWKPKADEIIKTLDKLTVEFEKGDKFEFSYDDEFKSYLGKNLANFAALKGLDVNNPESLKAIVKSVEDDFFLKKREQMFKTFKADLLAKVKDATYKDKHNIPDPNLKEAPGKLTETEAKNKKANEGLQERLTNKGYF
jgi:hypothetical protein